MLATARDHPVLAGFTLAYLAVFLVVGLAIGSDVAVPYVVLIVAVVALICRLDARYDLGTGTLWGMSLWGLGHLAGGIVPIGGEDRTLYNAVLPVELFHFDRIVHAFGFGFATLVCGKVLLRLLPGEQLGAPAAVLVALAGLGVGAVNEIVEFIATLVLPETNVGGYDNTGWDLIFDLAGGTVATVWLLRQTEAVAA